MCTKITQIKKLPNGENSTWIKMWIMWITRCITRFFLKNGHFSRGHFSTGELWMNVDKVDKSKIEHDFCAICTVNDKCAQLAQRNALKKTARITDCFRECEYFVTKL